MKRAIKTATVAVETLRDLQKEDQAQAVETLVASARESGAPEDTERLWTTGRAAREIGVHRNTVRNWALAGRFPAYRRADSDEILIPESQVQRLKELHSVFEAAGGLTKEEIGVLRSERRLARTTVGSQPG
ncbi:MAG: helix-turn-helix domain-containing protein [Ktedonobacterales bacterium]